MAARRPTGVNMQPHLAQAKSIRSNGSSSIHSHHLGRAGAGTQYVSVPLSRDLDATASTAVVAATPPPMLSTGCCRRTAVVGACNASHLATSPVAELSRSAWGKQVRVAAASSSVPPAACPPACRRRRLHRRPCGLQACCRCGGSVLMTCLGACDARWVQQRAAGGLVAKRRLQVARSQAWERSRLAIPRRRSY